MQRAFGWRDHYDGMGGGGGGCVCIILCRIMNRACLCFSWSVKRIRVENGWN